MLTCIQYVSWGDKLPFSSYFDFFCTSTSDYLFDAILDKLTELIILNKDEQSM